MRAPDAPIIGCSIDRGSTPIGAMGRLGYRNGDLSGERLKISMHSQYIKLLCTTVHARMPPLTFDRQVSHKRLIHEAFGELCRVERAAMPYAASRIRLNR
jgi:hypothetical protein